MTSRVYRLISSPCTLTTILVAQTVYSSGSLSNLESGTSSSSVKSKRRSKRTARHSHVLPYISYRIGLCLSESRRGVKSRDVISAHTIQ